LPRSPRPRRRIIAVVGAIALLQIGLLILYREVRDRRSGAHADGFAAEVLKTRQPAPALDLVRADGSRVSIGALRGRPVLVHFWATWCAPCREELPGLIETARRFSGEGLALLAVAVDDDWAAVNRFFAGATPAEVFRPASGDAHRSYDVVGLPDTYLVSRDGRLVLRYGGARDWRTESAARHLAAVSAEDAD
jgi:thiol-disulfide isomerase/thioredoxin